nr:MAG TPA: Interleukin 7/9 family [Caudoviricetes sp.]
MTRRNGQILNVVACSATSVESCLCLKAPREFLKISE